MSDTAPGKKGQWKLQYRDRSEWSVQSTWKDVLKVDKPKELGR